MSANLLENNMTDLSFLDSMLAPEPEKEEENPDEAKYIIHSKTIDKHTIKRTRIKLTPAVCDTCGFDVLKLAYEQNKISSANWDDLTIDVQRGLEQAKIRHKQLAHTAADNLIITESQLKKTKRYLSSKSMQGGL